MPKTEVLALGFGQEYKFLNKYLFIFFYLY